MVDSGRSLENEVGKLETFCGVGVLGGNVEGFGSFAFP